ncbi:hypothetical protein LK09_19655 [Microbacterium mangrovi]|uniref:HTH lysR-type domain-containing protein n=1 Tax=Microbacterium mangrovi TaxID=1348253 RepID=A0A0B1ZVM4_9MICO|nr:LysR family transcriptional regulator [Microbacterium mangrovi]KHK95233.1 hypothetical protein LK09_19655 [Microbacterium mangrovi]
MVDDRDLECVIAVAEELHFGRAAARLNIAQPALSKRVQKVEAHLGIQIFERNSQGAAMTAAGADLLGHARDALSSWRALEGTAAMLRSGTRGTVRIGAVGSAFYEALPTLLGRVASRLPDVTLSVVEMETPETLDALSFGDLDLGFIRPPVAPGIRARTVWEEQLVLAAPATSPFAARGGVAVAELGHERVIFFRREAGPGYWDRVSEMFLSAGVAFDPEEAAGHTSTILGIVALGAGVSIVPSSARRFSPPGVVYVPLAGDHPLPLAVVTTAAVPSPATRLVLDSLPQRPATPARILHEV